MELTITLDHGPLTAEFIGEDREEIEENLLEFIEFLQENEEVFERNEQISDGETQENTPELNSDYWEEQQEESESADSGETTETDVSYGSIASRTGFDEETIGQYFDIDPEGEEPPYLNFDADVLGESGSSRSEKQMRGSLIVMTLWREGNETEQVGSSELKDALRISGIDDTNLYNMYQFNDGEGDRYFRREGSGGNTEITLTMPGEREGFDQIKRAIERLEDDIEE